MEQYICKIHRKKFKYLDLSPSWKDENCFLCIGCVKNVSNVDHIFPIESIPFKQIKGEVDVD